MAEKTGSYFNTIIGAGITMIILLIAIYSGKMSLFALYPLLFILGICIAYQVLVIDKASSFVQSEQKNLTSIVANMIIMIFGYIFHSATGFLMNHFGGVENPSAYLIGVSSIPIGLVLGTLGFLIFFRNKR